jgi:hypothetical protein
MYVRSRKTILLVTPPNAVNEAMAGMEAHGYYTFGVIGGTYGGHATGGGTSLFDGGRFGNKPVFDEELPEDEAEAVDLVARKVREGGRRLHVVDVGKESALRRLIEDHRHHLKRFPVLLRPDGRRLEGPEEFTEAKLAAFLKDTA